MSRYLFDHLEELEEFKNDNKSTILTDIDGTISEITSTPEEAVITPSMKKELSKLKEKFRMVGVISGRSVKNAKSMVGVDGILYVGNHGMEYVNNGEIFIDPEAVKYLGNIKKNAEQLKNSELSKINGLMFEDKGICISIHYRKCKLQEDVRKKIIDAVNSIDTNEMKLTEGRKLVELKPPISRDKGFIIEKISGKI